MGAEARVRSAEAAARARERPRSYWTSLAHLAPLFPAVVAALYVETAPERWMVPWAHWLAGGLLTTGIAVATLVRARGTAYPDDAGSEDGEAPPRWMQRLALVLVAVPFVLGILLVLEFVKDDAYISFRYAHNLVTGKGLVFNTGDRLEGFTNFLWVLVLAPFEALGLSAWSSRRA